MTDDLNVVQIRCGDRTTLPREGAEIIFYAMIYAEKAKPVSFRGFMKYSLLGCPQFFTRGIAGECNVRIHDVKAWRYADPEEYKKQEERSE